MSKRVSHCWKDKYEHLSETEKFSDGWFDAQANNGTCFLPDGHDGPHEFTPDTNIVVSVEKPVAR